MRTVRVEAEVDLAWDVPAEDLAEALIESVGQEKALSLVANATPNDRGKFTVSNVKDEAADLLKAMQDAFAEIDRGHSDEGMRALRLLCAEKIDLKQWQAVKDGKHPFLSPPATVTTQ